MQELLDALGYVGGSLDKLGPRPLRGLLAGRPRELASILPFSDTQGITNSKDAASGRDVLNHWGLTDPSDEGMGAHLAGIGTEMALDPLGLALGGYGAYKAARGLHKGLMAGAHANVAAQAAKPRAGFMGSHIFGGEPRIENVADFIGPMHDPRQGEQLLRGAISGNTRLSELHRTLGGMSPEDMARAFAELPEGSTPLGSGVEAQTFRTPYNSVIRVSPRQTHFGNDPAVWAAGGLAPNQGRPRIPQVLAPYRSAEFGPPEAGLRVEHLPLVHPMMDETERIKKGLDSLVSKTWRDDYPIAHQAAFHGDTLRQVQKIDDRLAAQLQDQIRHDYPFLRPDDVLSHNTSLVGQNKIIAHDPGIPAIADMVPQLAPERRALLGYPSATPPDPELIRQALDFHSPDLVRQALKRMAAQGAGGQGITPGPITVLPPGPTWGPGAVAAQEIGDPMGVRHGHTRKLHEFLAQYAHLLAGAPA